jgi:hypothetical protein
MLVIGIAGKKRSGKDTVAQMLIRCAELAGVKATRRALADALKEECAAMVANQLGNTKSAADIFTEMNTDGVKERYRLLLQWWGTEFKRGMVSDTYWVDTLRAWIQTNCTTDREMVLIPDIRFPNEVEMVKQLGGIVIQVQRGGIDTEDGHASERALDDFTDWDTIVLNDSDLESLESVIARFFTTIADWAWGLK